MYEVKSLGLFVGVGKCNANCSRCAGKPLRNLSPKKDGEIDLELIEKTIIYCYNKGASSLTISGSGEPILSPKSLTKLMVLLFNLSEIGYKFNKINLYSNGISIGKGDSLIKNLLSSWRKLGLTSIYVTVHSTDEKQNAKFFNVPFYPPIQSVFDTIHKVGLRSRANIVLRKDNVSTFENFKSSVYDLFELGVHNISAWPIRYVKNDKVDLTLCPDISEMAKMKYWSEEQNKKGNNIRVLLEENKKRYENKEKLTLFPNGKLSNTWCV